ncbi:hypothetical protein [Roseicyclus sp.]|uniref:hypothetical protein n=1 Tax=Roseicyclus sp. TaxID=1914329 RepID=UPI003FA129BC
MTPPKTNLETQTRRHRGPIIGITLALAFVAVVIIAAFLWGGWPLSEQAAPDGVPTEVAPDAVEAPAPVPAPVDE